MVKTITDIPERVLVEDILPIVESKMGARLKGEHKMDQAWRWTPYHDAFTGSCTRFYKLETDRLARIIYQCNHTRGMIYLSVYCCVVSYTLDDMLINGSALHHVIGRLITKAQLGIVDEYGVYEEIRAEIKQLNEDGYKCGDTIPLQGVVNMAVMMLARRMEGENPNDRRISVTGYQINSTCDFWKCLPNISHE